MRKTERNPTLPPLDRLRAICLALPEATEKETWQTQTFRVRDKIFAMYVEDERDGDRIAVWCKAPPGVQEILVGAAPQRFFRPPYVGPKGWIGIRLDVDVDWEEVAELVGDSYRMTAPKRLLAGMDSQREARKAETRSTRIKPDIPTAHSRSRPRSRRR